MIPTQEAQWLKEHGLDTLNPQQTEAMFRTNGATLLLAVPGSGKTTVIVARTGYMVYVAGIPASQILSLTYTKAAAVEMKERYIHKFHPAPEDTPHFATINSFCVSVLNICAREKGVSVPRLLTNSDSLIRNTVKKLGHGWPSDNTVKALASKIGKAKNLMLSASEIGNMDDEGGIPILQVFTAYNEALEARHEMDFDDQLVFAYKLLQQYPDVLERARKRYQYVSLDEAQDTSFIQHCIVQLLVGRDGNIFMVGDEDQSIYGFRGACPAALLSFTKDYANAKVLYMEDNYRSYETIVSRAREFIKRNRLRHDKGMRANHEEAGDVYVTRLQDFKEQAPLLLEKVKEALKTPNKSLAILYRNNESAAPLMNLLMRAGISVRMRDPASVFWGHPVILDILAFLKLAVNPKDMTTLSSIYSKLDCFISAKEIELAKEMAKDPATAGEDAITILCHALPDKKRQQLMKLANNFDTLPKTPPEKAIDIIANRIGYRDHWIRNHSGEGKPERVFDFKVGILRLIATEYPTVADFLSNMQKLKELKGDPTSNVTLSTIHSSKGLEFDKVIMVDILETVLPHERTEHMTEDEIEEEARLFYVGMTRARHEVEIMAARSLYGKNYSVSTFCGGYPQRDAKGKQYSDVTPDVLIHGSSSKEEPPKQAVKLELRVGQRVAHQFFGYGTVTDLSGSGNVEILFDHGGAKRFYLPGLEKKNLLAV